MQIKQERKNKNKNQKEESYSQTIGDLNNFHQQSVNIGHEEHCVNRSELC